MNELNIRLNGHIMSVKNFDLSRLKVILNSVYLICAESDTLKESPEISSTSVQLSEDSTPSRHAPPPSPSPVDLTNIYIDIEAIEDDIVEEKKSPKSKKIPTCILL